jgi:hypothetical protein
MMDRIAARYILVFYGAKGKENEKKSLSLALEFYRAGAYVIFLHEFLSFDFQFSSVMIDSIKK